MKTIDQILSKYSRTDEGNGFYDNDVWEAMEEYAKLKVKEYIKNQIQSESLPEKELMQKIIKKHEEFLKHLFPDLQFCEDCQRLSKELSALKSQLKGEKK